MGADGHGLVGHEADLHHVAAPAGVDLEAGAVGEPGAQGLEHLGEDAAAQHGVDPDPQRPRQLCQAQLDPTLPKRTLHERDDLTEDVSDVYRRSDLQVHLA